MKIFFEALTRVLGAFFAGVLSCLIVALIVGLLIASLAYSPWLFFSIILLFILGAAVLREMEEIKIDVTAENWRRKE